MMQACHVPSFSVAVIDYHTQGNLQKKVYWAHGSRGQESITVRGAQQPATGKTEGSKRAQQLSAQSRVRTAGGVRLLPRQTSSSKARLPTTSQTVPPARDQVFRCLCEASLIQTTMCALCAGGSLNSFCVGAGGLGRV